MITTEIVIIGSGIAGASLAANLVEHRDVLLVEAEDQPGYHATGRSAAFWSETYGGPMIQPLTTASGTFLREPPTEFSKTGFLRPRGAVHIARARGRGVLDAFEAAFAGHDVALERLDATSMEARIPGLRSDWANGVAEPTCSDIDVAALHAAYLRAFRRGGGRLLGSAPVHAVAAYRGGWRISAGEETVACEVVVDAAGAWADAVASMAGVAPLGIRPYRRTVIQLRVDPPAPPNLPLVIDAGGGFYFKGEAGGRIWLSPHDETPCDAGDVSPEEIDIALAIDRLTDVVDWRVEQVERAWAGLRSFAPDRLPVYGFDPQVDGFFWCAGQGGFGIQTAPAAAKMAAGLLLGTGAPIVGIDPAAYSPDRLS